MSEVIKIKDIIAWCDKQVEEGKLLELCWEGGGDSGWVFFEVDGESADGEEISALVDMMYTELDYGSWAGEFSANGRAEYNSKTKCFEGIDYYSEDEYDTMTLAEPIKIFIPKSFGFDSVEYAINGESEDGVSFDISFNIINGFITPELRELEEESSEYLKTKVLEAFDKINVSYFNEHKLIERHEMNTINDSIVLTISQVDYSFYNETEHEISIDLQERLENENQDE
jgi:hypothetical protein